MATRLTIQNAVQALRAVAELTREHVVAPDELMRRALICRGCPMNVRTRGVSVVAQALARAAAQHRAPTELQGRACSVCGCPLELLTATLPANLHVDSAEEAKKRPKECWLTKARKE